MTRWILPAVMVAAIVFGALFFSPPHRLASEAAPAVQAAEPTTPEPVRQPEQQTTPLHRELLVHEKTLAKLEHGEVMLPAGMLVELVRDDGEFLEVLFGNPGKRSRAVLPRSSVINRSHEELPEPRVALAQQPPSSEPEIVPADDVSSAIAEPAVASEPDFAAPPAAANISTKRYIFRSRGYSFASPSAFANYANSYSSICENRDSPPSVRIPVNPAGPLAPLVRAVVPNSTLRAVDWFPAGVGQ